MRSVRARTKILSEPVVLDADPWLSYVMRPLSSSIYSLHDESRWSNWKSILSRSDLRYKSLTNRGTQRPDALCAGNNRWYVDGHTTSSFRWWHGYRFLVELWSCLISSPISSLPYSLDLMTQTSNMKNVWWSSFIKWCSSILLVRNVRTISNSLHPNPLLLYLRSGFFAVRFSGYFV
jgi:hypothetical protein